MKNLMSCLALSCAATLLGVFSADYVVWAVQLEDIHERAIKVGLLILAWMLMGLAIALTIVSWGQPSKQQQDERCDELHSPDMEG